jgi:hypothetical protein
MIPLFAATSAISAISAVDKIGSAAISQWKHLTAGGHAGDKPQAGATSDSFGALLAAHGVSGTGPVNHGTAAVRQGGS